MRYYVSARFWFEMEMRSRTMAQLATVTGMSVNVLETVKARPRTTVSDAWARAAAAMLHITRKREFEFYFLPAPSIPLDGANKVAPRDTAA